MSGNVPDTKSVLDYCKLMSLNDKSSDRFVDKIIVITVIQILNPVENVIQIMFLSQKVVRELPYKHDYAYICHGDVGKTVHLTFYIKDCIKIQ